MSVRPFTRDQFWLLPPRLDDLIGERHPVRFVAGFVDALESKDWAELGVERKGEDLGAPSYDPRLLLSVWLYGFMTGVRSSRKLEAACREQVPYLWLTALQAPDHNTLWRFYQGHRQEMRKLLKRTVKTAVVAGLVDLALQAVDGSKVMGNAAKDRFYDAAGLARLMKRLEAAIADLEAQNQSGGDAVPLQLPERLKEKQALLAEVKEALARVEEEEGLQNLTDPDARLLKGKDGFIAGYNGQAVVSPLTEAAGQAGQLITAAAVTQDADDHYQLIPMLEAAAANSGQQAATTLADAGYHSGRTWRCARNGARWSSCRRPKRKRSAVPTTRTSSSTTSNRTATPAPLARACASQPPGETGRGGRRASTGLRLRPVAPVPPSASARPTFGTGGRWRSGRMMPRCGANGP